MLEREQNPAGFIMTTLAQELSAASPRQPGIMLGIDECLNNGHIEDLGERLIRDNVVQTVVPLWYQQRVDNTGQRFIVQGSSPSSLMPGRHVQGTSWADERVIALLVAHFSSYDRLCLLTQNTKNDLNGLRRILTAEVGPAVESLVPSRLGLLVLARRQSQTGLEEYAAAVETRLKSGILLGFSWEEL